MTVICTNIIRYGYTWNSWRKYSSPSFVSLVLSSFHSLPTCPALNSNPNHIIVCSAALFRFPFNNLHNHSLTHANASLILIPSCLLSVTTHHLLRLLHSLKHVCLVHCPTSQVYVNRPLSLLLVCLLPFGQLQ